jgi:hypothetical protein
MTIPGGLWHGWLNHAFELAGVLCQPRPEPTPSKRKATTTSSVPAPQKTD